MALSLAILLNQDITEHYNTEWGAEGLLLFEPNTWLMTLIDFHNPLSIPYRAADSYEIPVGVRHDAHSVRALVPCCMAELSVWERCLHN